MIANIYKYIRRKLLQVDTGSAADARQANAAIAAELDYNYRRPFRDSVAFQTWMLQQDKLDLFANESFDEALRNLFQPVPARPLTKLHRWQVTLLKAGKNRYLERLYLGWSDRKDYPSSGKLAIIQSGASPGTNLACHARSYVFTHIDELDPISREYFIWQHLNHFSIDQLVMVTATTKAVVMERLWTCFCSVLCSCGRQANELCSEPQFSLLFNYFNDLLTTSQEAAFSNDIQYDQALQDFFGFFLSLKYEIVGSILSYNNILHDRYPTNNAGEFVTLMKDALQKPNTSK